VIVYQATKERFLHDNDHAQIEDEVQRAFVKKVGRYVSQGEFKSWRHSLAAMARVPLWKSGICVFPAPKKSPASAGLFPSE
jgi:hypothetical protein